VRAAVNRGRRRLEPVLIRTRFSRPPARPGLVERRPLRDRLEETVAQHRVTLVSAPPGFGKTTLASQWVAGRGGPAAWLALDRSDTDPDRFVRYLVAAVEDGTPHRLPRSTALLAASTPPPFEHLCEVLASELATAEAGPLLLVLEDYHLVESKEVHGLIERLVSVMPPSMHLLVLSRVDPPWPLGHWRAQRWLGELRARDLRFSLEEARQFFEGERGAGLSGSTVERLHAWAEGWVAALQLVQLSLRDSADPEEHARALSGTGQLVADYLVEEVLAAQPPEILRFLTVTAPLKRFSAPLCDHLLAGRDEPPARETLARILRLNLFLVPIDAAGEWYSYHHLFQDLLLHHLPELARPERRAEIEHAAGEWFAREGLVEEGLRHLIHAGAIDAAAELLGTTVRAVLDADLTRQVLQRWVSLFPPGAERGRLPLLVAHAYLRMARWDLPGMGELLDEAARLLRTSAHGRSKPDALNFHADIEALAAFRHYWNGDPIAAMRAGSRALDSLPPRRGGMTRWLATRYKAASLALTGRQREALELLEAAIQDASATGERGIDLLLLTQGGLHWYATDLGAVALAARRMLALHDATPIQKYQLGHAHHLLGIVAYAQNRLDVAASEFRQVVEMRYQVNSRIHQDALIGLCLVARATGEAASVASHAVDVRATALQAGDAVSLRIADWFDLRLTLDEGDARAPVSAPPSADDSMYFWLEVPSVTYAEALLRDPSPEVRASALPFIERALEKVDARHNQFQSIVFSILRAQALAESGDEEAGLDVLAGAVRRAEPSFLVRPFLDRGPRLRRLLEALASREGREGHLAAVLSAFDGTPTADRPVNGAAGAPASAMLLSNREIDVLELLTQRLSNKEIADRLNVSAETIKKHTRNLYLKLEVHGRREAVAKALAERLISIRP